MIRPRRAARPVDVAAHYDELDWLYRDVWGEHVHHGLWNRGDEPPELAVRRLVDHVADRAGVAAGDRVCDAGCGYGATARHLAERREARVVGITVSRVQGERARAAPAPGRGTADYVIGDWLRNPFADTSFDAVLALESTEHFPDLARGAAEARRVLRPGGRYVVCAWLAADAPRAWEVRHLLEPICSEGRLPGLPDRGDQLSALRAAGLDVEQVEDVTERVKPTWSICIARTLRGILRDQRYRSYLLDARAGQRVFARTVFRIWLAYETGALRYGIFTARR